MAEFFAMGGYADFVWPAYGLAALVLVWLVVSTLRSLKLQGKLLADLEERLPHRRRPNSASKDSQ